MLTALVPGGPSAFLNLFFYTDLLEKGLSVLCLIIDSAFAMEKDTENLAEPAKAPAPSPSTPGACCPPNWSQIPVPMWPLI